MVVRDESPVVVDDKPVGLRIHWHSYIFDTEHSVSLEDCGGETIMPYCDNPRIEGQRYGPGLMMAIIYNAGDPEVRSGGTESHAMLALVRVPDHSLFQNSISHHRRSRHGGAIGEVIWAQSIATDIVMSLHSQNLIIVQRYRNMIF
jgi:hypothetical protein